MSRFVLTLTLACLALSARAAEEKKSEEPLKIEPVDEAEKAKLLAAETPQQKALRAELAAFKDHLIVFNSNATGRNEIYVVRPDGSELMQVTKDGGEYPYLSPDCKRIVFSKSETPSADEIAKVPIDPNGPDKGPISKGRRVSAKSPKSYVWVINVDGSGAERVAAGGAPHWAPNGKAVAYQTDTRPFYAPAILDLEKKGEKILEIPGVKGKGQCMPAFSPDGKWLMTSNGPILCWPLNAESTGLAEDAKINKPVRVGHVCNSEFSPDGQWLTWVIDTYKDEGSWLCAAKFDPSTDKAPAGEKMKLGWEDKSVNYFPDVSPCSKYMVYVHADCQAGVKSWLLKSKQDLYISRFPADGVNVRLTWTGASCQHPNWQKPKGGQ